MTSCGLNVRNMVVGDLKRVVEIQRIAYDPFFQEELDAFESKFASFPSGCFVLERDGDIEGYIFSFPAVAAQCPVKLNSSMESVPSKSDCYYIHDVCIDPTRKVSGMGTTLARHALETAREFGFDNVFLLSVQQSQKFWERLGFESIRTSGSDISSYGSGAALMKAVVCE